MSDHTTTSPTATAITTTIEFHLLPEDVGRLDQVCELLTRQQTLLDDAMNLRWPVPTGPWTREKALRIYGVTACSETMVQRLRSSVGRLLADRDAEAVSLQA